jgi:hypothetical protein
MSIVTGRRQRRVTDAQIAWYRATSLVEPVVKAANARRARVAKEVRRRRIRPKHVWAAIKRRVVGPVWRALPRQARTSVKRALGRSEPAR